MANEFILKDEKNRRLALEISDYLGYTNNQKEDKKLYKKAKNKKLHK